MVTTTHQWTWHVPVVVLSHAIVSGNWRTDYFTCVEVHDHNFIDFHVHDLFWPLWCAKSLAQVSVTSSVSVTWQEGVWTLLSVRSRVTLFVFTTPPIIRVPFYGHVRVDLVVLPSFHIYPDPSKNTPDQSPWPLCVVSLGTYRRQFSHNR